ncbi:hypothetical protein CALVIDRAFT_361827 [Calocera viscosa TUFC12733]|uniref:Uncharacterized protein n=1 Tax=Calocera viscosa (strain TUFC12733) TaxID=1330018 RepID=A0A167H7U7_CALVF|nr:hypothetical protein CALVIDRAFT_361827 [Calocera viscosa TUFC12733]
MRPCAGCRSSRAAGHPKRTTATASYRPRTPVRRFWNEKPHHRWEKKRCAYSDNANRFMSSCTVGRGWDVSCTHVNNQSLCPQGLEGEAHPVDSRLLDIDGGTGSDTGAVGIGLSGKGEIGLNGRFTIFPSTSAPPLKKGNERDSRSPNPSVRALIGAEMPELLALPNARRGAASPLAAAGAESHGRLCTLSSCYPRRQ